MTSEHRRTARRLETWFERHGRALPWREQRSPYRVWVSEVMLQQTRADTVARRFPTFVERFPDIEALAAATEEDVLKAWQGLGYYQRARRLHRAAQQVVAEHGGELPSSPDALRTLPGFGPYTAAAVAAFAFGAPTVAVDANVRRVGARWLGLEVADDAQIATAFDEVIAHSPEPSVAAEALIEVGALACTPTSPACDACPLRSGCAAHAKGSPTAYPRPVPRRKPSPRRRTACLHADRAGLWLERRPPDGLLGGLWGVPQTGERAPGTHIGSVQHEYTHLRLQLDVVAVDRPPPSEGAQAEHVAWSRLAELPVSAVDLKVLAVAHAAGALPPEAADAVRAMMPP